MSIINEYHAAQRGQVALVRIGTIYNDQRVVAITKSDIVLADGTKVSFSEVENKAGGAA